MPDEIEQHHDHRLHNLHQFHINESKMMRAGNFLRDSRQFDAEMQENNSIMPGKGKISESKLKYSNLKYLANNIQKGYDLR